MEEDKSEIEDPKKEFFPPVEAGANFTVYIGGLAALHRTTKTAGPNYWQVAFLDDIPNHVLKARLFTYDNGTMSGIPQELFTGGKGYTLSFDLETEASTAVPSEHVSAATTSITRIGDFSSKELHGDSAGIKPVGLVKRSKGVSKLTLKSGTGYTAQLANGYDKEPDLYCFSKAGNVVRELGHWFAIDNQGKLGTLLNIKVEGPTSQPSTFSLEFTAGREYKLVIDNMCWSTHCETHNDFPYYYKTNRFGSEFEGIVDEEAIDLILVKPNKLDNEERKNDKKLLNYRVACNVMLISNIADGQDLFSAQEP